MGLIDDADSIIDQEQRKKRMEEQAADRIRQRRVQPVDKSHYTLPVTLEVKAMLVEFVEVMRKQKVLPSPCVVANGKRTFSRSIFGVSFSEKITLSLAGYNAWCIQEVRYTSHHNEFGYAITEKCELVLLIPFYAQDDCSNRLLPDYFPGYVNREENCYGSTTVVKSIDTKALQGTSISYKKKPIPFYHDYSPRRIYTVLVADKPALVLNSMNIMGLCERDSVYIMDSSGPKLIAATHKIDDYSSGYGEDTYTVDVTLRDRLLKMIIDAKRK